MINLNRSSTTMQLNLLTGIGHPQNRLPGLLSVHDVFTTHNLPQKHNTIVEEMEEEEMVKLGLEEQSLRKRRGVEFKNRYVAYLLIEARNICEFGPWL